jgi:hypothetical protein
MEQRINEDTHTHTHTLEHDELMNYSETDKIDPHILCLASRCRPGSDIPRRLSY